MVLGYRFEQFINNKRGRNQFSDKLRQVLINAYRKLTHYLWPQQVAFFASDLLPPRQRRVQAHARKAAGPAS
jgi:hypothetical protein